MLLSIEHESTLEQFHKSVDDWPTMMEFGFAIIVQDGAPGGHA
jgi:hypothetical protein